MDPCIEDIRRKFVRREMCVGMLINFVILNEKIALFYCNVLGVDRKYGIIFDYSVKLKLRHAIFGQFYFFVFHFCDISRITFASFVILAPK